MTVNLSLFSHTLLYFPNLVSSMSSPPRVLPLMSTIRMLLSCSDAAWTVTSPFTSRLINIISLFMTRQCLSMYGQPVYGDSPVVSILDSPRCLCYCYTQGSTVFLNAVYPVFWGLPFCIIPCTPPSSVIFRYLSSFFIITWPNYLKCHCPIL